MITIEICINCDGKQSVSDAVAAALHGGASTIELCSAMHLDGLTPSTNHILKARAAFHNKNGLMVMIRPREGDFCYSWQEIRLMKEQIKNAADLKADGVVFGVLEKSNNALALDKLHELIGTCAKYSLKTTFHRAFDATTEKLKTLELLIDAGVDRILTSGSNWEERKPAIEGLDRLAETIKSANDRIEIVIGGGINSRNVKNILKKLPHSLHRISVHAYSGVQVNGHITASAVSDLVHAAQNI